MGDEVKKVYIYSYPRSGNSMLSSMMLAALPNMSFESVYAGAEDAPRFLSELATLGVQPSQNPRWKIVKTHHWVHFEPSDKIIWLVRDGRDAMTSYWFYHLNMNGVHQDPISFWQSLNGEPLNGVTARWDHHVEAVKGALSPREHLVLRYEEMRANPAREISRVGDFLSEVPTLVKLAAVDFDHMRSANAKFYRSGKVGGFRQIDIGAREYLERELTPTLREFGYV